MMRRLIQLGTLQKTMPTITVMEYIHQLDGFQQDTPYQHILCLQQPISQLNTSATYVAAPSMMQMN